MVQLIAAAIDNSSDAMRSASISIWRWLFFISHLSCAHGAKNGGGNSYNHLYYHFPVGRIKFAHVVSSLVFVVCYWFLLAVVSAVVVLKALVGVGLLHLQSGEQCLGASAVGVVAHLWQEDDVRANDVVPRRPVFEVGART